ncbi:MAG: trehalose-phosphatase [Gemmatimonadales bacterium]|nr:MAG: trehalose-phosphatase [Gemmatimonadales bacterium]
MGHGSSQPPRPLPEIAMSQTFHFDAAIFDMDGVITDTAKVHAVAWKELIDEYLAQLRERTPDAGDGLSPFRLPEDYRDHVDGKPRYQGLGAFLEHRGIHLPFGTPDDEPGTETVCGLANGKDRIFNRILDEEGAEIIQGTVELIGELKGAGLRVAVASSSRNCRKILERAGLLDLFEARVDGETLRELGLSGKPDPDMFVEAARRIGAAPDRSIVFEDAGSGIEAGRRGEFGLVVGVAEDHAHRIALRDSGAHLAVTREGMGELTLDLLDAWFSARDERRPSALEHWPALAERLRSFRPAIFLDYDGTLTPIVSRPDQAVIPPDTQAVVRDLADRYPTTVVSGRGRDDVARLVGVDGLNYAGSHGYDIETAGSTDGGTDEPIRHEAAAEVLPLVEELTRHFEDELSDVDGTVVEPKRFTVAVHYRMVADDEVARVEETVRSAVSNHPELQVADGKKVFEIRPDMDWDKGKAILWLQEALGLDGDDILPLYVGDDTTDEDAFRILGDQGLGVVVTETPRPTHASYQLQDTVEVREFLRRIVEL